MRRAPVLVLACALAGGLLAASTAPAGAQTGDVDAFCAARLAGNTAEGKAANLATMETAIANAPASVLAQITALRDAYEKKGDKIFDRPAGQRLLTAVDEWVYENCPGTQVPVTAIDYEFEGIPATLPAGFTTFRLSNSAPKEDHEMVVVELTEAGERQELPRLFTLSDKKVEKLVDFSTATGAFAPAGEMAYAVTELQPGTYAYACFLPVGGKKKGAPHFMQGMYGTFTVS